MQCERGLGVRQETGPLRRLSYQAKEWNFQGQYTVTSI